MTKFSTVLNTRNERKLTIATFDYIRNYQAQLISFMIYETAGGKHKQYRDEKLLNEIKNCEKWMKKHVWKLQ